ncbi:TonB-dependent siderophore receptor [Pseudomonas sp. RW407]|uniref:TonB-dependent siderophore receptor n=1 Tax=Pseudomonas sp. RW407 TaxID=2202894 RepID=UPI000D6F29AF|nr:TonB-dependent receptor [Pseudomonas sp. RW407]PWU27571.1 TonB-dependent siderophore receptor [Pseudomonas sp. RW407]
MISSQNPPVDSLQPLRARIRLAILCSALLAPLSALADAPATQRYQIAAGDLSQVLTRFAAESGIVLSFDARLTRGQNSAGLDGSFPVEDGLRTLLAGTGIRALRESDGRYTLVAASTEGALEMDATSVIGQGLGETTEHTGSYTTGSNSTATKMPLSLRETPQSVSVITRQRMDDESLITLGEVLEQTTGLTVTKWGGERERYNSRGFQVENLMVDGLPIQYEEAALSTGAMAMYDRVEVVRGASGLMEGTGTPAGSINLVRKRPTREFQGSITGSAGRWDDYRSELDLSGALNEQGTLRGRTVLSYQDKNSYIDYYENQRSLAYGILEADLDDATTLSLGASYSKDNNPGADWNGLGTYPDGSFLPISRSTRMSPSWSYWDKESRTFFAELEHRFDNDWKGKLSATWINSEMDMLGTFLNAPTLDANGEPQYAMRGGAYNYDRDQKSFDGYFSGPFSLLGRDHSAVFGASRRSADWHDTGAATTLDGSFDIATINPLNWNPNSLAIPPVGEFGEWNRYQQIDQTGVYGTLRLSLADPLSLVLGGRADWYELDVVQYDGDYPYGAANYKVTRKFTPYAGVVYDLNDTYSVYASWTRIFNPQNYQTAGGSLLEPQEGTNYEVGLKAEYLQGRVNASLALFQIDLENLPDALPTSTCATGLTSCYSAAGEVRSRGVELEVNGEVLPGWNLTAGYTYNSAERVKESDYDPIGVFSKGKRYGTNLPQNLFKLGTSYRLPGELNRWRVGGALHTQSKISTPYGVKQGGYTLVDLSAGFAATRKLDLQLNIDNLFDKRYYSSISDTQGSNFFGDPRSYRLTAKYSF